MIRAVFDTNVVISGRLWSGAPREAINIAVHKGVTILISEAMLDELRDVLNRPKFHERLATIGKTAAQIIEDHLRIAEIVEVAEVFPIIQADPDDDVVLACAIGGRADCIVTGDEHLLALGGYQSLRIWDVSQFLQHVEAE